MQTQWQELIESLENNMEALTFAQIKLILSLFEHGLSGYLAAQVIRSDGCEVRPVLSK